MAEDKNIAQASQDFKINEVIELKGHYFKVVLIDAFTGKIAFKWIDKREAEYLKDMQNS